ncbi:carbohydrate sulfotransferase 9-like isoform X1 [Physella acuta]|uniref:carbohydrate sulfotransferase 9-like isoform X1 n=1 Tax=Physella acuta TaxID=109671 RepID=UPI0027DB6E56|nr:carbohydrate sulfotransferase 9-like isoform X1 [Physella acuta]XP_059140499.1 carbohydrate sulfotransferase 9-like isoform X1 [Physella acuta]XP_059140500.1 carbohydrate sulfotransferase 9-like isoform X1 [Physella acuta]
MLPLLKRLVRAIRTKPKFIVRYLAVMVVCGLGVKVYNSSGQGPVFYVEFVKRHPDDIQHGELTFVKDDQLENMKMETKTRPYENHVKTTEIPPLTTKSRQTTKTPHPTTKLKPPNVNQRTTQPQRPKNVPHPPMKQLTQAPNKTPPPAKTDADVWESMSSRRKLVEQTCARGVGVLREPVINHTLVSRMHHFIYCPVEKTASTFWRRFLYQLEFTDPMQSPFDVSVKTAYDAMTLHRLQVFEKKSRLQLLLDLSTKLLFVRDPYSRIFSAYVDKLLAPNPVFWETWGVPSVRLYRNNCGSSCGDDVTFSEFVSYTLDHEWGYEPHVMPIFRLCSPCWVNYTIVGKMETFRRDTRHLLTYLQLNESRLGLERLHDDVVRDAVEDSVNDAMSEAWLNSSLKCTDKIGVAKRIWRKLQIRGLISWRRNFDLDPKYVETMQGEDYINILKQSLGASTDVQELALQKEQAKLEAFSTLTHGQISKLQEIYMPDFKLFGYDEETLVDQLKNIQNTNALDWTKSWDMEKVISKNR